MNTGRDYFMLELMNVYKSYQTKDNHQVEALKDVSLKFKNTGLYFILGKSGCGKSTLLNLIAGLDTITSGKILFEGNELSGFSSSQLTQYRNFKIGFIFQEFNLISNLNVKENIALALKMQGKKVAEKDILDVLKAVDMEEFIYRRVNELSGGQKQRIAIARAVIKNPRIIVADEPAGALDSETSNQIFSLLKDLSETHLVIVVSHQLEYAQKYANEIIHLKNGYVEELEVLKPILDTPPAKEEEEVKRGRLPFSTALKIGFTNLRLNLVRLCILIFLSVISFVCLGVSITAFQYDKNMLIANAIADGGYKDSLTIISSYKKSESSWQQTTISPATIQKLNEDLKESFLGVYQEIGSSDSNFKDDIQIDYSGTYDALSLFSLSGMSVINQNILDNLGYSIYGSLPARENEILITQYFYETFIRYGYSYQDLQIEGSSLQKQDMIGKIIEIPKYRNSDITIEYKICGIMDTKLDIAEHTALLDYNPDKSELKDSQRLIHTCQKGSMHSVGYVAESGMDLLYKFSNEAGQGYNCVIGQMPNNKKELVDTMRYLEDLNNDNLHYQLTNTTDDWIKDVDTLMTTYKMIGGIAGAVLIVFSSLLLFNYINLSIYHKTKEMGILRALGARGADIFQIFGCEGFLIALINFIFSAIGTSVFIYIINNEIKRGYFLTTNVYPLHFLTFIALFLISFLSCFLSIFIPILRVSKKPPVQAIRVEA